MTKARDLANIISGSGTLNANVIPALPASKITSGTFADARLSSSSVTQHVDLTSLSASNLTSGTVPSARLSLSASDVPDLATSKITSGTFADARLSASSVTQHVDLSNLNASNLTSGSIPNARVPSGAVTQHVSPTTSTTGTWTPDPNSGSYNVLAARYQRVGDFCLAMCWVRGNNRSGTGSGSSNIYSINNLPITARNTGDSTECVGQGFLMSKGSAGLSVKCIVMSGATSLQLVRANTDHRNPDSTYSAGSGYDPFGINGKASYRNMYSITNEADGHMSLQILYLV